MKLPAIIVNFKTYSAGSGESGLILARMHEQIAKKKGVTVAVAVQAADLRMIASELKIPVLAQHFDLAGEGAFTGHVTAQSIKACGAYGSLLNHAEKKLSLDDIEECVDLARRMDLFTVVCAESIYSAGAIAKIDPDLVAVEPPELIGGDVSVSSVQPQLIADSVGMAGKNKVLVGAGIKSKKDVQMAVYYGAAGVLVASGIVKSLDPEKALNDLIDGILEPYHG